MISRISGKIIARSENCLTVEVQGLCYEVFCPPTVLERIPQAAATDNVVNLITYHYHQVEPSRSTPVLIGFINEVEKDFFERFITVSGIGPRAAVRALNKPISEIARAIDDGDLGFLTSLPGIGPQRAREIVAKLQGKVGKFGLLQDKVLKKETVAQDIMEEALEVLSRLQYKKYEASEMIKKALERSPGIRTCEELLNEVYRQKIKGRG
ncbi:MAG: Holliday junction branch migration protein RuvA [Candidatus Omnitrophota bacterium]